MVIASTVHATIECNHWATAVFKEYFYSSESLDLDVYHDKHFLHDLKAVLLNKTGFKSDLIKDDGHLVNYGST